MTSVSSSFAESETRSGATAAGGAPPRDRAAMSLLEIAVVSDAPRDSGAASSASSVAHSAEGPVNGARLVASSPVSPVMAMCGVNMRVPSAPSLPEVERLILELLSLPSVPMKPGSRVCNMCRQFIPTDVLVVLPVCSHLFHQSCIVNWLRSTTPSCCPSCHASITIPGPDKTEVAPTFSPDEYDIESQMLVPNQPGEGVAKALGESHGWLRSSLDRLSGSWGGCSSNRATAAVAPVSSRCTTGSWSHGSSGHLDNDSDCDEAQNPLRVPGREGVIQAVRGSVEWLRSLRALSGRWSWRSISCSAEMVLPVTSRHVAETQASNGHNRSDSRDLEAAVPPPERPPLYGYTGWFSKSSG
ncbi:hypothetical protein BS78_09G107400 [Paspalum vaginatum]|nr:hypothetical protein BS78_09G107400 [Paspalum vaginatum]